MKIKNKLFIERKDMKYEVIEKILPDCIVYYKEGIIEDFSKITEFILSSADECISANPNIKCLEPEYCYVSYLDKECKEKNIRIRYSQAVTEEGIPSGTIKFKKLRLINVVCIYHKGSYSKLKEAYSYIIKWANDNNYEITEPIRERYIDGMWNRDNEDEWLTEIQVPIEKIVNVNIL